MPELMIRRDRKQARYFTEQLHEDIQLLSISVSVSQEEELTAREREIWQLREARYSFKEIAAELNITLNTVKKHLKSIYAKRHQTFENQTLGLHMILIPGGTFLMGSPDDEPERNEDEGPQRVVHVPSFFMGRYPVTQSHWRSVAALEPVNRPLNPDPSEFKGENRPVECVSWYDAVEFCDRLSRHTGKPYRLPTEAEWEYACRAGTTTPFYFGKTLTTDLVNYNGNSSYRDGPLGEHRGETTPVNHFEIANAFGLCDMHGNIEEWCEDHWHNSYNNAPTDGSAWLDEGDGLGHILRGGAWDLNPRYCRSASRSYLSPSSSSKSFGFRVACNAPSTL